DRLAVTQRCGDACCGLVETDLDHDREHLREGPSRLTWSVDLDQMPPRGGERLAEIPHELGRDLPQGLRLLGELRQVVAVVDGALAEAAARMRHPSAVAIDQLHDARPDEGGGRQTGPCRWH